MRTHKHLIPAFLLSLALAACASSDDDTTKYTEFDLEDPRIGEEVDRVCRGTGVDGFGDTTRNTVVVSTSVSQQHLLKVAGGCFNLKHAQSISVKQRGGCLSRGDSVYAFDSAFGPSPSDPRPQRCLITNIYEYDMDALDTAEAEIEKEDADAS